MSAATARTEPAAFRSGRHNAVADAWFYAGFAVVALTYVLLIVLLVVADIAYMLRGVTAGIGSGQWWANSPILVALGEPEIQHSIILSLLSCTLSAVFSLWVAVPIGYLLARVRFPGRELVDSVLDIPIVLPPLVVGLSLLILFQFPPFTRPFGDWLPIASIAGASSLNELVVYQVPAVILAQFMVAAAFAVRTMKATFESIDPRCEQVALTLGCSRFQAFGRVVLPEAGSGMVTAWTLAWARSLGEFGPLLIFAGATRNKTEVLSTTVFLELSVGNLEAAVAVSLIMITAAVVVLTVARVWGRRDVMV